MFRFFFLFLSRPWPPSWLGSAHCASSQGRVLRSSDPSCPPVCVVVKGGARPPGFAFITWLHPEDSRNWLRRKDSHSEIPPLGGSPALCESSPVPPAREGRVDGELPRAQAWPSPVLDSPPAPTVSGCALHGRIGFLCAFLSGEVLQVRSRGHRVGLGKSRGSRLQKVCPLRCLWQVGPAARWAVSPASACRCGARSTFRKRRHRASLQGCRRLQGPLHARFRRADGVGGHRLRVACLSFGLVRKPDSVRAGLETLRSDGDQTQILPLFFSSCRCW